MDLAGAFTFKKVVDKFKDNSAGGLPAMLGRTMVGSRERPNCLVFSLTIVNVDHAKLTADEAAAKALEAAIKESVVAESADAISLENVALTTSAVEGAAGAWRGVLGTLGWTQEDFEPAISVECTITLPQSTAVAHLEEQLGSSSTLNHTGPAATANFKDFVSGAFYTID